MRLRSAASRLFCILAVSYVCLQVSALAAPIPVCGFAPDGVTRVFSESTPQCTLGNTGTPKGKDVFPGYLALCEDGVNAMSTDCNGNLGRSDVLYFQPIGITGTGFTDIQVAICSANTEPPGIVNGDQDNNQPMACAGMGGILAHATTLAFAENTDVVTVGNNKFERDGVTMFTSPDKDARWHICQQEWCEVHILGHP